ncbi:uncharacterized protein PAC_04509 [Phialocephala subalpina]|uniref:A-pheromone receptor PreA n=1 Tax=Phialocephala subalpina TaxID=576137 RepID=A0A1L7WPC4_9HELO|nr:uncharacterized protein PAC_04509 [Phialocephala subalpina]
MIDFPPYYSPQANAANAVALPFFALVGILITYLPLCSFWTHGNVPAVSIVIANGIYNLWSFLNPIIWPNDDQALWWPGYGLCDIEGLLSYPVGIALAASLCALSKGLAACLDTENARVHQTVASRRRKMISDVVFCWGIPILQLALHYVVQSGRYQIYPVYGCADVLDNSWPTIIIILMWLPFFTLLNMYYAVLLLIRLRKHRRTISSALTSSGSGFGARKYLKLVIITLSLIVIYLPIQIVLFMKVVPTQLVPYSWSRVHDPIIWKPIEYLHTGDYPNIQYNGWAGVGVAFLLWAFFGFNDNAVDTYRLWMVKLGLAHFWPSLKDSREARRAMRSSRRGSSVTRVSLSSSLDFVGKVMKYFDGDSRRASDGTTIVDRQSNNASRKGSHGTLTGLVRVHTGSTNPKKDNSQYSSTVPSNYTASDIIAPAPPTFSESRYPIETFDFSVPAPEPTPTPQRPNFSTFRTHLHVPFPLFGYRSTSSPVDNGTQTQLRDLEAQYPTSSNFPRRTFSIPVSIPGAGTTVQTNIWSPAPLASPTSTTSHAKVAPMSINEESDEDIDIDPLAPKMGTRAYREREKREMQRRRMEERQLEKESEKINKIMADNVKVELGMETLGWNAKKGETKEVEDVRVVKSFEVTESAAGPS